MEKISILIPTYNVERFLEQAIYSIINQTYTNLEIIIVDDCSTDNTFFLLKEIAQKDSRIKLFRNETNKKIAETLNFAFSKATGTLIGRMDGDDLSSVYRFEKLYAFLIQNPNFDLVGSQTNTIDEEGNVIGKPSCPLVEANVYLGLKYKMSTVAHIWLAKREVYDKMNGYRLPPVEDYDFLLRAKSMGFRFTNLDERLYSVRIRKGNTATTQGLLQRKASSYVFKLYEERLKNGSCNDSHSTEKFEKKMKVSKLTSLLFSISNSHLQKALSCPKYSTLFMYNVLLAIVLSPNYQIPFLVNRFKMKRLK